MKTILTLSAVCSLLFFASCHHEDEHHENTSKYPVSKPFKTDTSITQEYVCQIHAYQHIEIRAQERGYLEQIFVDEGQLIKEGERMFQVMPRLYAAEVQRAKAEAQVAEIEYRNTKALADSDVVSQNELAMAKANLDKVEAELSLAQVHLDFTRINAPFTGIMDRFEVRLGSLLEEGELLTTLSDNRQMWVYFNVPEAEYLDYKAKVKGDSTMSVKLLMANNKLFPFAGEMKTIEADFNNETGNIAFRATFPNPDRLLRHGETGTILMNVPLGNALLIPQKATFDVLDKKYVYVVDEAGVIHAKQITIAAEMPHLYAVASGLQESDAILLDGLRKVKDGDKIDADHQDPKHVISHLELYSE